jgi:hypothetical protein
MVRTRQATDKQDCTKISGPETRRMHDLWTQNCEWRGIKAHGKLTQDHPGRIYSITAAFNMQTIIAAAGAFVTLRITCGRSHR